MPVPEQQPHTPPPSTMSESASASVSLWSRLSRGTVLAIGAGLGAAVVGACWAGVSLAGGNGADTPEAGTTGSPSVRAEQDADVEGPFSTDGTLTVAGIGAGLESEELCSGTGGYSDIDFGTQVNVTDAAGTLVAVGSLGFGEKTEQGCEFPFTVDDITPGSKFYTVEVSHRGGLTQTEDELRAGGLAFTLGD
ncbi:MULTISPECIES: hypothetical protein [unclassified Streptomyces]|uniref:hypothetical protein n=1 Tax=unclassified Streptomyces TaxID=2593676 RepID=UPI000689EEAD|nr:MULTISPECIES: hypothetical protein [unclassified Streptomyces]